ncbi:MAG: DUF3108 domain-containing protein [Bacteroidota bacterium]
MSAGSSSSSILVEGEELVYNVRYGPFDLGQVRFRVSGKSKDGGFEVQYGRALIDSYEGVPFVDLHATYESWMDSLLYPHKFMGRSKEDGSWQFGRYRFDYQNKRVIMETGRRDTVVEKLDTLSLPQKLHDGLSLFFFARQQVLSGKKMNISTLINEELVNTYIDFYGKRTSVEIDAVDYPIDVIEFNGKAEFVGIFGLTGDFEGWFSNDDARVPILAKMKVIIGSVTLELMEWKRPGWNPQRGIE